MITEEERKVVEKVQKVGREKYYSALHVLADILGVDVSGEEDHGEERVKRAIGGMLGWVRKNYIPRKKEFLDAGLEINSPHNDYGQYRELFVTDRDVGNWKVKYMDFDSYSSDEYKFRVWGESWCNLLYLGGNQTADSSMGIVSTALKCLSRWQAMAAKYNVLKGTCAEAYRQDSLERAEKARHQLELLEKL